MKRNIEVVFKPEKDDPYKHDYHIRISSERFTNVIRLSSDEFYALHDKMYKLMEEQHQN